MSEYIAKCNEVVGISGKTLIVPDYIDTSKEIVRCRDCERFHTNTKGFDCPKLDPDGFCAWAERRWLTCKCGHEMESEGSFPMCGRYVREDGDAR